MSERGFKFREATLKRCKVVKLDATQLARLAPISLEFYHFLYQVSRIDFAIWFRVRDMAVEYIRPEELSKELLDEIWEAMQRPFDEMQVCVLVTDKPRFDNLIDGIRTDKIKTFRRKFPGLDQKTLDLYASLSAASQMVVAGGIDANVIDKVRASAAYLVSNMIDSDAALSTLSRMIICDPTLYDHSASVAMIASVIAMRILPQAMTVKQAELLSQSALYHDIGKTCVPSNILNSPNKLTPEQFEIMKKHTILGHDELMRLIDTGAAIDLIVARVASEHHEKWDGNGYPYKRRGAFEHDPENGIHLFTRIVTISDIYSALLMKRVYKAAFEPQDAIKIMASESVGFDPGVFVPFLKAIVSSLNAESGKAKGRILQLDDNGGVVEWSRLTTQKTGS